MDEREREMTEKRTATYALSNYTQDKIDDAYNGIETDMRSLREQFKSEPAAWRNSDAGEVVKDWLEDMARFHSDLLSADWNINPLTDSCMNYDDNGAEVDDQ